MRVEREKEFSGDVRMEEWVQPLVRLLLQQPAFDERRQ